MIIKTRWRLRMKHAVLPLFLAGAILLVFIAAPVAASLSTITSVSPDAGYTTGKSETLTITGTNFSSTEGKVWLEMSGQDNLEAKISSWSNTTIVCKIRISTAEKTGDWDVVVERGEDQVNVVKDGGFTIASAITLTSITPVSGQANDDNVDFTLLGTGLSDVQDVYLYTKDVDDNTTAVDVNTVSSTKVKGTFDLTDAGEETYDVCVIDSHDTVKCGLSFKITTDKVGSIEVSSSPIGATILIDGKSRGTTPDVVNDVLVGSRKVVLQKNGYDDWGKMVMVEADDIVKVDANLVAVTTVATTVPTPEPTVEKTPQSTTEETPEKTTAPATPATTKKASPLDPLTVIGAAGLGIGLVVLRRH
jgi:hypothetical protein